MTSRLVGSAMAWLGTLVIVRHLSVANWGKFTLVFGVLTLAGIVMTMVNPAVVLRQLANDDGRIAGTFVLLRLALGLLGYVLALSFVTVLHYPTVVLQATAIAGLGLVIGTTASGFDVVFQYRMQLPKLAVAATLGQVTQLGLIVVLAFVHPSLIVFTIPAVVFQVVVFAWKRHHLPKRPVLHYRFIGSEWLMLIKLSFPLAIAGALVILYYNLDTVMLSKMQSFRAVAIYGIAYKFAGTVVAFSFGMNPTLFPVLVRYWPDQAQRFRAVLTRTVRLYVVVSALVTLEFTIFAADAIGLLYGHHYAVAAGAARLVVISACLGFFGSLGVMALIAMNRNVFYSLAALVGLVLNLGLNLWLIPRWSYMGAAWATLVTEVVVTLSIWIPMARSAGARFIEIGVVVRVLLCTAAAVAAAAGTGQVAPWPVAAVVAGGAYVVVLALTRVGGRGGLRALVALDDSQAVTS
jgi:O-antigen/teichoic acid export membrane protein